jgi:uncharacterized protein (TIGR02147 family)
MTVYSFTDYKRSIDAFLAEKPRRGHGLLTQLASSSDMTSAQISQVLRGDREFTLEQALKVARFMGLSELEQQYFFEMVNYARAGTTELRNFAKQRMEAIKAEGLKLKHQVPAHEEMSDESKARFYSSWMYSAIRMFCSIRPQQLEDIMKEFNLTRSRANSIVGFLLENQLCAITKDGIVVGKQTTFIHRGSPFVFKHHGNWRRRALESAEAGNEENLFYTSPVSMSQKDFQKFSLRLTELIKEFSSVVRDSPSEIVACMNMDFFKVSND